MKTADKVVCVLMDYSMADPTKWGGKHLDIYHNYYIQDDYNHFHWNILGEFPIVADLYICFAFGFK